MANLQVRIDDSLKTQAQIVAESMGLDLTQSVRMGKWLTFPSYGRYFFLSKEYAPIGKSCQRSK